MQSLEALIINVIILAYVLYRQAVARPVNTGRSLLSRLLLVVGAINLIAFLAVNRVGGEGLAIVLFSLTILAIGFGAVRAYTVRLWRGKHGLIYRQGTRLTIALWVAAIALHTYLDAISGTDSASLYLYFGITLTVQRLVVGRRAAKLA